jgi:hypothetical protein
MVQNLDNFDTRNYFSWLYVCIATTIQTKI